MTTRPDIDYVLASQRASRKAASDLEQELAQALGGNRDAALKAARKAVEAYIAEQTVRIHEENPELHLELEGAA